jgi:MraZ protein
MMARVLGVIFSSILSGYDGVDYESKAKELFNVSILDNTKLADRRLLFASTIYAEIDEQGRFLIPKNLLDFAKLSKKVMIVGVGDHFEIWDEDACTIFRNSKGIRKT